MKDGLMMDGPGYQACECRPRHNERWRKRRKIGRQSYPDPMAGGSETPVQFASAICTPGLPESTYCDSVNGGADWACRASIDSVFDGPTFFKNDQAGWVGGGEISPKVEGWVRGPAGRRENLERADSGRSLADPRDSLRDPEDWLGRGRKNYSSNVGGMYFSHNGGKTWALDVTTGAEMDACDSKTVGTKYQAWCAGYNGSFSGG